MKNIEVINLYMGLRGLASDSKRIFPGKVSYAISRNLKKLLPIVEDFENARIEMVKRYGAPVENKEDTYTILEENQETFNKEMDALENADEEVQLSKLQLQDIEKCEFSISEIEALSPMISEED